MNDRAALLTDVLDELTLHAPGGFMKAMRKLPAGPMSLIHLHVLMTLDTEGPQPMGVIADALDVSQASATGIVDRMEQRGLVERHRDVEDRRVVRVALTEGGRRMIEGVSAERRDRMAAMLEELTDEELRALLVGTRAMRRARERHFAAMTDAGGPRR